MDHLDAPDGCGIVLDDTDILTDDDLDGFTLFAGVDQASVADQAEKWLALRTPTELDQARQAITKAVPAKGRALWLPDVLRAAGLRVVEVQGWQTRGNPGLIPLFQMFHHTASRAGNNAPSLRICTDGRPDLKGPLCQVLVARDGTCYIVASGIANHAGAGLFPDGSERGNVRSIGWECENNGVDEPWSAAQLEAIAIGQAAVCRHTGRPASSVVGHREYARPKGRKPDPRNVDLLAHRARVATLIQEDDMTPEDRQWIEQQFHEHREWMRAELGTVDDPKPESLYVRIRANTATVRDGLIGAVRRLFGVPIMPTSKEQHAVDAETGDKFQRLLEDG